MQDIRNIARRVSENVEKVILGKPDVVELVLVALVARGHVLIEDVPGVGKTTLAKAISQSIGCTFKRVQFTPDILPSDVSGVSIFNQKTLEFEFRPGPIMAQIVLADEINRATPKTQSSLLEAMEEQQVTVDGVTYNLPEPFLVMATQNPIEYEGTYPLPESQLDRFFMRISMGYTSRADELEVIEAHLHTQPIEELEQVIGIEDLLQIQEEIKDIYVDAVLREYIVDLVRATRDHREIYLGASTRGSLALFRGAQVLASFRGRDYVIPDDVKHLCVPTLAHRLIVSPAARIRNVDTRDVVQEILDTIAVPGATAA
ncbi:MAG: AAA family ATPase [Chloroflexi bacterium]|nr:AAA family ATPase [Chloroflexota bacterium]MCY3937612.1 AAA family ATPase [Chloroflexota bacterium]